MHAIALGEHGPAEVLELERYPDPVSAPGWVIVELRAAAVSRRDTLVRAGAGPVYRFGLPLVLGSDGAGVRRDTGDEVVILPSIDWGACEQVAGHHFESSAGQMTAPTPSWSPSRRPTCFPNPPRCPGSRPRRCRWLPRPRTQEKLDRGRELGADVAVNYRQPTWASELSDLINGADLVLDSVGSTWPD